MHLALRWSCRFSVLVLLACAMFFAAPRLVQASDTPVPPPLDIDEAIKWGMNGDPTPYLLQHKGPAGRVNPAIVGVVYTPFLRVALAAKAAHAAGRDFTASDVTPDLIAPVLYVAYRWYCCVDSEHGDDEASWDPAKPPVDYKIVAPGESTAGSHPSLHVTSPLWVSRDVSRLTSFARDLPYRDVVVIAAYPMSALREGANFAIYREWGSAHDPQGGSMSMLVGEVTPEDLTHWR